MTCVCSLAGTAACKTCWNNPNSTGQLNNFVSWNTTSNYDVQRMNEYVTFDQLREELRNKPDLVEVVRCRDCKYLCDDGSTWGCGWHCSCLTTNDGTPPDGFCAWGTPKNSETTPKVVSE